MKAEVGVFEFSLKHESKYDETKWGFHLIYLLLILLYSQLSLSGHLSKADTSLRRTPL